MIVPPAAQPGVVPDLPASHPCEAADIRGLWKLLQVYEEPSGPETAVFYSAPSQYIEFKNDNTFDTYEKEKDTAINLRDLAEAMKQQNKVLQQYVLQNEGQLYFYRGGVAYKQQACFIAVESNNIFSNGQMLLMPPNPQSLTRWVKLYSRVWRPGDAPPPIAQQQPTLTPAATEQPNPYTQPSGPTTESMNTKPNKKKARQKQQMEFLMQQQQKNYYVPQ